MSRMCDRVGMSITHGFSERFDDALVFAADAHRDQRRKGRETPYIGHLLGVCSLVIENGGSEDEAIAALLHDAVEDQGGPAMAERIRERFGDTVVRIVLACTDTDETPKPPWRARKEAYIAHVKEAAPDELRVSLADKLHNARAILRDHIEIGDEVWGRFTASHEESIWYYRTLADLFLRRAPGPMASELDEVVTTLERRTLHPGPPDEDAPHTDDMG